MGPLQGTGSLRPGRIRIERRRPPCAGQKDWVCIVGGSQKEQEGKQRQQHTGVPPTRRGLYPSCDRSTGYSLAVAANGSGPLHSRTLHAASGTVLFTDARSASRESHEVSQGEPLLENPIKFRRNSSKKQKSGVEYA